MNSVDYNHKMAAHCETGTVTGLLNHHGLKISESLVFGISAGIFFAYLQGPRLPFPLFVHRSRPGSIRKNIKKQLGVSFKEKTFPTAQKAMPALDQLLERKIPVAIQGDMFYMDYIPKYMRVHFNGHFIVVVGKEQNTYTISDCYYPQLAQLSAELMSKARFAKGDIAPHGLAFFAHNVPSAVDLRKPIINGIREAARNMVKLPIPFIGVKGIRMFGRKIVDWPKLARDEEHLSHEVMMINANLEDRGTGGAGFRFMYATFLQEAAAQCGIAGLADMSKRMMANGDKWRELSLHAARIGKNKDLGAARLKELQEMIFARADEEELLFKELLLLVK